MKKRIRNLVIIALSFAMLFSATLFSSNAACTNWVTERTEFQCIIGQRCALPSPESMYTLNTIYYQVQVCDVNGELRPIPRVISAPTSCCYG